MFFTLPISYFFFGVPLLFGPYCFIVGLAGGFIIKLTQESPRRWLEPATIVALPLLAAIPMALLWQPLEAFGTSIFWAVFMLAFRKKIFGEAGSEPSPRFRAIYLWTTERR